MKHTPGPWTRGFGNHVYTGTSEHDKGPLIATCMPLNGTKEELETAFANARLIAAAPDMMNALQEIHDKAYHALDLECNDQQMDTMCYDLSRIMELATKVIRAAKGD